MKRSIADQVRDYMTFMGEDFTPAKLAEAVAQNQRDLPPEKRCKRQNIESLLERDFQTVRYLIPLAKAMGATAEELTNGDFHPGGDSIPVPVGVPVSPRDEPPAGYVRLQHLSPQPSMGPGTELCEPVDVVRHLDVLESWVRQKVGSANYDRIKILTGCGQSMRPTIQDQDLVFVDVSQRFIDIPGIYAIDVCGRFLLKRALILTDGTLVLKSDNAAEFPDEERIDLRKAADSINVAGRVKAWWTLQQG